MHARMHVQTQLCTSGGLREVNYKMQIKKRVLVSSTYTHTYTHTHTGTERASQRNGVWIDCLQLSSL